MILVSFAWAFAAVALFNFGLGFFMFAPDNNLMDTIRDHQTVVANQQRVEHDRKERIRNRLYMFGAVLLMTATFFAALH